MIPKQFVSIYRLLTFLFIYLFIIIIIIIIVKGETIGSILPTSLAVNTNPSMQASYHSVLNDFLRGHNEFHGYCLLLLNNRNINEIL